MAKAELGAAKTAKRDEFYTRYVDIEKEVNAYLDYDENTFRDKTVLLPCDDPEWSDFTKFFAQNFEKLGLRKLISTSHAPTARAMKKQPTLFETSSPIFDQGKSVVKGRIFTLTRDTNGDKRIDVKDLEWNYLEGDGDFRSMEVKVLRDEADIVITNPPFSLFREFIPWIISAGKKFLVIGNINAITYKEIFPLIKDNQLWLGATNFNTGLYFKVPDNFVYASTYKFEREIDGVRVNRVPSVCWYTNLDHGRRHQPLKLMTKSENKKYSKHKEINGVGYQKYVNCNAIEVPFGASIPSDHQGLMGVPITFLDKYNPDQFEIIKFRHGDDGKDLRLKDGSCPYFRILIRHRSSSA